MPGFHTETRPSVARRTIQHHGQFCTGHGDRHIRAEFDLWPHKDSFQTGGPILISDQHIGCGQRQAIHRTPLGDTKVEIARTAQILNGGCKSRFDNLKRH